MTPLLPLLPTREVLPRPLAAQPCGTCPHRATCWRTPEGAKVAVATCRIQSGIDVDQSAARLVEACWPALVSIGRGVDAARALDIARDLAREVVEAVPRYTFGGGAEPIWWLLTGRRSAARLAASRLVRDRLRERQRHVELDEDSAPAEEASADREGWSRADDAWRVIEDGVTLSTLEYRVLTYLIDHAGRHAVGLQHELATRLGVTRSRVTRAYHLAVARVRHALGETTDHFRSKGVVLPAWAHTRRQAWAARVMPQPAMLSIEQRTDLLLITQRVHLTEAEVAWGFGVGPTRRATRGAR